MSKRAIIDRLDDIRQSAWNLGQIYLHDKLRDLMKELIEDERKRHEIRIPD